MNLVIGILLGLLLGIILSRIARKIGTEIFKFSKFYEFISAHLKRRSN